MKIEKYKTEGEWLEARKDYITATKAYKLAKGQKIEEDNQTINTCAILWGRKRELIIADYIINSLRSECSYNDLRHSNNELYIHENGRDAFSPDVIGNNVLYEIKTSSKFNDINDLTAGDIFKTRPEWFAQIQWQLYITGFDGGYLVLEPYEIGEPTEDGEPCFIPHNIKFFYVEKDAEYIKNMLNNIEANVNGVDLTPAESEIIREYTDAYEVLKEVESHLDNLKPQILDILKLKKVDNLTFGDFKFISSPAKTVKRFSASNFKADNPELYEYYIQESVQKEFLKVTKKKENNGNL